MLRQALITPSRALCSTTQSIARRPLSRPQTFIAPITVRRIQPAAARWYSEAKESQEAEKKDSDAAAKPASEGQDNAESAEPPAVAELKKKLETKEKEVSEWKVGGAYLWDTLTYP